MGDGRFSFFVCLRSRRDRAGSALAWAVALLALAGCVSTPKAPAVVQAPPTPSFESFMEEADRARAEGSETREMERYRAAAAAYPTRKEPWSRLASHYFAAADHGNAILAAQEVLQRDAQDTAALSMLAVSGLRVAAAAVGQLSQRKELVGDTRTQAEAVVKTLRQYFPELFPPPAATPTARPAQVQTPPPPMPPPAKPAQVRDPCKGKPESKCKPPVPAGKKPTDVLSE